MADKPAQTYANHRKFVFGYHVLTFGVLVLNLLWTGYRLVTDFGADRAMSFLLAWGLLGMLLFARAFPLRAQDRLIRLEERLRMESLLPPEIRGRIGELRVGQVVALRFASDEELPELVRRVLDGELRTADQIKQAIRRWRADTFRV